MRQANRKKTFLVPSVKTQVVSEESGELLSESITYNRITKGEKPKNYASMFLEEDENYDAWKGLGNFGAVWGYILRNYKRENAIFFFSASVKEDACKETDLSIGTVRTAIASFCDSGLLLKVRNAEYMVNPTFFHKGTWEKRLELIEVYDLKKKAVEVLKSKNKLEEKTVDI